MSPLATWALVIWLGGNAYLILCVLCGASIETADDWMALANAVQDDPIDTEYARLCREAGQA